MQTPDFNVLQNDERPCSPASVSGERSWRKGGWCKGREGGTQTDFVPFFVQRFVVVVVIYYFFYAGEETR